MLLSRTTHTNSHSPSHAPCFFYQKQNSKHITKATKLVRNDVDDDAAFFFLLSFPSPSCFVCCTLRPAPAADLRAATTTTTTRNWFVCYFWLSFLSALSFSGAAMQSLRTCVNAKICLASQHPYENNRN